MPKTLANTYREAVLSFVWRQWAQMGVSGSVDHTDPWCQDPEALLIFTCEVARSDPRMFDEVLDWLVENGEDLMRQRLKNILALDPTAPSHVVDAVLDHAGLPLSGPKSSTGALAPLFQGRFGDLTEIPDADAIFRRHGLLRPPFQRSKKSRRARLETPFNLTFRLRSIFGPSSRSEALRCLLSSQTRELGTSEIAEAITLSRISTYKTLQALSRAGVCTKISRDQKDAYWIIPPGRWLAWLDLEPSALPRWVDWPATFRGLAALWRWLNEPEPEMASDYIRSSRARAVMDGAAKLIEGKGLRWKPRDPSLYRGEAYWKVFEQDIQALADELRA